jgi:hypothetical protein
MVLAVLGMKIGFAPQDGVPVESTFCFLCSNHVKSDLSVSLECPPKTSTDADLKAWLTTFVKPTSEIIVPRFLEGVPGSAQTSDLELNEAIHILQFLTLFKLLRESLAVAHGEVVMTLKKACLPVFHEFHRTKYRSAILRSSPLLI